MRGGSGCPERVSKRLCIIRIVHPERTVIGIDDVVALQLDTNSFTGSGVFFPEPRLFGADAEAQYPGGVLELLILPSLTRRANSGSTKSYSGESMSSESSTFMRDPNHRLSRSRICRIDENASCKGRYRYKKRGATTRSFLAIH